MDTSDRCEATAEMNRTLLVYFSDKQLARDFAKATGGYLLPANERCVRVSLAAK